MRITILIGAAVGLAEQFTAAGSNAIVAGAETNTAIGEVDMKTTAAPSLVVAMTILTVEALATISMYVVAAVIMAGAEEGAMTIITVETHVVAITMGEADMETTTMDGAREVTVVAAVQPPPSPTESGGPARVLQSTRDHCQCALGVRCFPSSQ
mmetsp:Transcript_94323/g.271788  ORF Transcript_94323/g.271788 Transcript_94323/m.271788 type:complete len:154 (+) Transcript_94323:711-1172(+)